MLLDSGVVCRRTLSWIGLDWISDGSDLSDVVALGFGFLVFLVMGLNVRLAYYTTCVLDVSFWLTGFCFILVIGCGPD